MCCFSKPVRFVANTKIFARPTEDGTQVLAYQMRFGASGDLAMVLPLPVPPGSAEDAVRFIDLSGYPTLFDDLSAGFPAEVSMSRARGMPQPESAPRRLVVHDVGEFEASFVPTLLDFDRLDERFRLPPQVWDALPTYADYGFAVFKLRDDRSLLRRVLAWRRKGLEVHPMAFELPLRSPGTAFFPTVHVHDERVHPRADFDHTLYLQGADEVPSEWERSEQAAARFVDVTRAAGLVQGDAPCFRRTMTGTYENVDVWV